MYRQDTFLLMKKNVSPECYRKTTMEEGQEVEKIFLRVRPSGVRALVLYVRGSEILADVSNSYQRIDCHPNWYMVSHGD